MISARWLRNRHPHWQQLEALCQRTGRGDISALKPEELQELSILYRQIASDLATVREDPASRKLADYLNRLMGRAHNLIYMGRKADAQGILYFYINTYPQVFRASLPYTLCAGALFIAAALAGAFVTVMDPGFQRFLLGGRMAETIEHHQMWTHSIVTIKPLASSLILTNNLTVAFAAFAGGIAAGFGSVYSLLLNGLLLGVVGAACWGAGMSLQLWSFVAPHGVLELPALIIAGASGLQLGRGLLFPGFFSRLESLRINAGQSVRLLLGTVPLLLAAGVIEGFLSPSEVSLVTKFLVAALLGTLLVLYLAFPLRATENARSDRVP